MALTQKLSNVAANAEVDALTALLDGGFLDIYDGAQPATADTPGTVTAPAVVHGRGQAIWSVEDMQARGIYDRSHWDQLETEDELLIVEAA